MAQTPLQDDDPRQLGDFSLMARLGSGGMGIVYLGSSPSGVQAAVKTLHPGVGVATRARIRREAELLQRVENPHLPRLLAAETDDARPWIAMSYVQGPSLAEAAVPLDEMPLRQLAGGLAEALDALHEVGVVHRDVKPANIVLTFAGPVLVDLGIAEGHDQTALTETGLVVGSPGWMAPEQLRDEPTGAWTDVWGWGAVMAFAATGVMPFGGGAPAAVGWRILNEPPKLDGLPDWLDGPVRSALDRTPASRPSVGALARWEVPSRPGTGEQPADATRPAAADVTAPAVPLQPTQVAPPAPVPVAPVGYLAQGERAPRGVRPPPLGLFLVAVLVTALVGLAVGFFALRPAQGAGDGATSSPSRTSRAAAAPPVTWSMDAEANTATSLGSAPAFPTDVDGYTLAREWRDTVRIFSDGAQQTLFEFPATMNGCDLQRFFVRWRSVNENVLVEAVSVSSGNEIELGATARGTSGWQSTFGCAQPAFRWVSTSADGSTLADVVVEVQQWEVSP